MEEILELMQKGADVWNAWRKSNEDKEIILQEQSFTKCNFRRFNLRNVDFRGSEFSASSFSYAWVSGANFSKCDLSETLWYRAKAISTIFDEANLDGANLTQGRFEASSFQKATLRYAKVQNTKFTQANLSQADFRGAIGSNDRTFSNTEGNPIIGRLRTETNFVGNEDFGSTSKFARRLEYPRPLDPDMPVNDESGWLSYIESQVNKREAKSAGQSMIGKSLVRPEDDNSAVKTVWFGTNRQPENEDDISQGFLGERDKKGRTHYGQCTVNVPRAHKIGKVSDWWRDLWGNKSSKLTIEQIDSLRKHDFFNLLGFALQPIDADEQDLIVFVHGYNVSFNESIIRGAQLSVDLKLPHIAVFSWPSRGSVKSYPADEASIEVSEDPLIEFFSNLKAKTKPRRLHVIAHSMGNRAVTRSISEAIFSLKDFGHLILAAPDVDSEKFKQLAKKFSKKCESVTLYTSNEDKALKASGKIHQFERAGYLPPVIVANGIDTIDVNGIDLSFLGHGYVASNRAVLSDMFSLLHESKPPDSRFSILPSTDKTYWKISK